MASFTNFLKLLKKNPATDGKDTFNIETMLNENWDKIDQKVEENSSAIGQIANDRGYVKIKSLGSLDDLNNIFGSGKYFSNQCFNRPISTDAFLIDVTGDGNSVVVQKATCYYGAGNLNFGKIYERIFYQASGGWTSWREIPTVNNISNPNLIINPDFRINQRGQTEYTFNINSGCSVDRWVGDPNYGVMKVIPNDGFLRLEQISIGTGSGFHAVKETIESSKNLSGKKVTLGCEYRNKAGSSQGMILINSPSGVVSQKILEHKETWTKAQLTVELPQLTGDISVWLYGDISKSLGYTDFKYTKLELGEIATPLSPRPYGEELALCQRYYETFIYTENQRGILKDNYYNPQFIQKRVPPTLEILNANISGTASAVSVVEISNNGAVLKNNTSAGASTESNYYFKCVLKMDSEIY